jgi:Flavin-binding monooxygenase-like
VTRAEAPPAARCGQVVVKPAIERLGGGRVCFVDGSEERIDPIVSATGYRISLPFLPLNSLPRASVACFLSPNAVERLLS